MKKRKSAPWRIVIGCISMAWIALMWAKNDILSIYTTMPREQIVPLIIMTVAIFTVKVLAITGATLFIKWIVSRIRGNQSD